MMAVPSVAVPLRHTPVSSEQTVGSPAEGVPGVVPWESVGVTLSVRPRTRVRLLAMSRSYVCGRVGSARLVRSVAADGRDLGGRFAEPEAAEVGLQVVAGGPLVRAPHPLHAAAAGDGGQIRDLLLHRFGDGLLHGRLVQLAVLLQDGLDLLHEPGP